MTRWIKYTKQEMTFLRQNNHLKRREMHAAFVEKFNRPEIKIYHLKDLCRKHGWVSPNRRPKVIFSSTEIDFVRQHASMTSSKLHSLFVETFDRLDVKAYWIDVLRRRLGLSKPKLRPAGFEVANGYGYIRVRLDQQNPREPCKNFALKHRLLWERQHGPIPKGYRLKCLSGDRSNCDPSNWECVPNGVIGRVRARGFKNAPDELKPIIMNVAKLEHFIQRKRREGQQG